MVLCLKSQKQGKRRTTVFSSKPQKQPEREDLGPWHLQFLDEQAEQERLWGKSEAL